MYIRFSINTLLNHFINIQNHLRKVWLFKWNRRLMNFNLKKLLFNYYDRITCETLVNIVTRLMSNNIKQMNIWNLENEWESIDNHVCIIYIYIYAPSRSFRTSTISAGACDQRQGQLSVFKSMYLNYNKNCFLF